MVDDDAPPLPALPSLATVSPTRTTDLSLPVLPTLPRVPIGVLTPGAPTPVMDLDGDAAIDLPAPGYDLGDVLGRGGMGEVLIARDQRIGREVAVKRMRAAQPSPTSVARFLREGRIQARLDHPSIVPVYELGNDAAGKPFFTMKRVTGVTLTERIADPNASRQAMLRAFAEVCLAIELAHSRGVVHRDLKPSNIMLGDFGEVYVIDWGVALVIANRPTTSEGAPAEPDSLEGLTATGMMLGTPGYMAPEQISGENAVTPAADVYALGATLFELLTGEPLHPRGTAALASTLTGSGEAPAHRRPERAIAPELDAACAAALDVSPDKRPTARELAERIQRYLDGDRDVERRRNLAAEQLVLADVALASGDHQRRGDAVRAAGHALALDPESTRAAELLTSLIVQPPSQLPPELVASLEEMETGRTRARGRSAFRAMAAMLILSALLPFLDITHWTTLIAVYVGFGGILVLAWVIGKTGVSRLKLVMVSSIAMAILFSRIAGPFVLVPIYECGVLLSITSIRRVSRNPWIVVAWATAAVLAPLALEWSGLLGSTAAAVDGHFVMRSAIFGDNGTMALVALIVANVVFLVVAGLFSLGVTRDRREAQRQAYVQAWHLGQLLPRARASKS